MQAPSSTFIQTGPALKDTYAQDPALRGMLRRLLPADVHAAHEPALARMGALAAGELAALAEAAERAPPVHVPYDAWGRRIDHLEIAPAWRALGRVAAEQGLVALAYERPFGAFSRLAQLALVYLFAPSSATYSCPLAMTDGAARLIEQGDDAWLRERTLPRLLSRDPGRAWTSGQWMTERPGGSDVGRTETRAEPQLDGSWRLFGVKWFTSAIDADIAFTLARPTGAAAGSRGLALFYVELRDARGALQGIEVHRLKDKLGTKALPTAELTLAGTPARLCGAVGEGVRRITTLMNVTRVWNATCSAASLARGLQLARDYAQRREAFGGLLSDKPLLVETLADLATEHAGALALVLEAARLLGREEVNEESADDRATLRLLTPLLKLYTARQAVRGASEAIECMGGAGYVEDTGIPRLLRDAQVLTIWEGTTNVLALDALRAIAREGALLPFLAASHARVHGDLPPALAATADRVREALHALPRVAERAHERGPEAVGASARVFAFGLARTFAGALLIEHAAWALAREADDPAEAQRALAAARRWCSAPLLDRMPTDADDAVDRRAVLG